MCSGHLQLQEAVNRTNCTVCTIIIQSATYLRCDLSQKLSQRFNTKNAYNRQTTHYHIIKAIRFKYSVKHQHNAQGRDVPL